MANGPQIIVTDLRHATIFVRATLVVAFASAFPVALAQSPARTIDAPPPPPLVKQRYLVTKFPDKPSVPPSWSIPLEPLGFTAPGAGYLGARYSFASLDFLDEDHLLFTFRVPGLLHRESAAGDDGDERQIRALVLSLPQGTVEAEAQWRLHDRVRYLWMLKDGHFLLRDRNGLLEGDATLALKPLLDFPGPLLWLDLDPTQKLMVTNSREPAPKPAKPGGEDKSGATADGSSSAEPISSQTAGSANTVAGATADNDSGSEENTEPDLVVRILHRDSGNVMLVTRVRMAVHLPINSSGYIENLRGRGSEWILNLRYFTGGSKMLGSVESACAPADDFLSDDEILVTGCGSSGESKLVAITTDGKTHWITQAPATEIWPELVVATSGQRLAWETLDTDHSVNSFAPLGAEDVKEQSVTVFDAANGDIALVSPVSPILDTGGNVAVSPTGRRVALLNAGSIQVFELPPPPPLPLTSDKASGR